VLTPGSRLDVQWTANGPHRLGKDRLGKGTDIPSKVNGVPFEEFWIQYPKKVEKKMAEQKWNRLPPEKQRLAMADLPARKLSRLWQKDGGRYIPNPTTYINGERWNDEIEEVKNYNLDLTSHGKN
jgi:hypothetical protein